MRTKCNLDESAVIRDYKQFGCARACAEKYGVSNQTIYRILIRNDIPRKNPKEDKERVFVSNCKSKYCPALIVMLRTVCELSNNEIAAIVKAKNISSVCNIISRRGLQKDKPAQSTDVDMNKLEAEYLAGASTYELGEKYGVYHSTISKWMKQRGHVRGKGYGSEKGVEILKQRAIKKLENKAKEDTDGSVVLVEFCGDTSIFKCNDCGAEFSLWRSSNGRKISCPKCREKEIKMHRELREKEREEIRKQAREEEYAKDKICVSCGCVFHSKYKSQLYCSDTCSRREKRKRDTASGKTKLGYGNHRKRARILGVPYEPGITLKKLIKRDNNICQICGEPCDTNDTRYGYSGPLYPSIDHIVAMANGGGHTWDNVQLAHVICNSAKRNLTEEELTEEVITHAKKQAIAHKCA